MYRDVKVWINGQIKPLQSVHVSVLSHGLHYGGAVFEGVRVYGRKAFKLTEHLQRFRQSAKLLKYSIPYSLQELEKASHVLIDHADIQDGYLRPLAWRGDGNIELYAPANSIQVALLYWEWPSVFGKKIENEGVRLQISQLKKPSAESLPFKSKASGVYLLSSIAKFEACSQGYDDALLLDYRGYIAEASAANIFFVKKGCLHTPIADVFLNGITRQTVQEIAKSNKIRIFEGRYLANDLKTFDEVFLTGTAYEILPVKSINHYEYEIGPVTQFIRDMYRKRTRERSNECKESILA